MGRSLTPGTIGVIGPYANERHRVKMPDGELNYRLLSLPLYLAEQVIGRDLARGRDGRDR